MNRSTERARVAAGDLGTRPPYDWLVVSRCTKKLLDLLRVDPVPTVAPSDEDFYTNVLVLDRRMCLLVTHAATLFSIFEPGVRVSDLQSTGEYITALIERELRDEGCPSATFGDLGSETLVIAKTADRRVLGCMNDMAFFCEVAVGENGGLARLDDRALNRTLRRHINGTRDYQRPIDLVRERLAGLGAVPGWYSAFVPARSTNSPAEEVAQSLGALAVAARALSPVSLEADGRQIPVETRRSVSQTEAEGLARKFAGGIIVADRISAEARRVLAEGRVAWLDRRGHLQLRGSTVHIDADVPPLVQPEPTRVSDLFVPTGLDVAVALLLQPEQTHRTTEVATLIGRSPGRVSEILAALRDRGLVDRQGRPSIPDLFNEMADAWAPSWRPLRTLPQPDDDLFRLSGTLGAVWHQAPVVATADWPAEIYVETQSELRAVLRSHGGSSDLVPAGRVAVCPSRYGWTVPAEFSHQGFSVANHVVVALDLAQDRGRGREILEGWDPGGHVRVW